ESMTILQKMQEDTARLHRQFLEGQEAAGRTFQSLLENQQRLLMGQTPLPSSFSPMQERVPTTFRTEPTSAPVRITPAAAAMTAAEPKPESAQATAAPAGPSVATALLAVVSEKTGYPVEMLDLDMGLDSDLGIDSIKRVEILSAIQEKLPDAPLIGPEHLGSLQTLGEIASFLGAGATVNATAVAAVPAPAANAGADAATALLAVVSEKTGYPVEMLDLDMGLDSDLGIDSIKRVEILSAIQERLPDAPLIGPEHLGSLQTLGEIAGFLAGNSARAERVMPEPQAIAADIPSSVVEKHQD